MKKTYIEPASVVIKINAGKMICDLSRQEKAAEKRSVEEKSQSWYNGGDGLARESLDSWDEEW